MAAQIYRLRVVWIQRPRERRAMYASITSTVKKGHEEEFARAWQEAADQASLEFPGVTFRLLRDVESPRRFVAISGAWRNAGQIAAARDLPSFRELMALAAKIAESSELSIFELAAEIS
jgi:heme-degrading monooxygenase HmoA